MRQYGGPGFKDELPYVVAMIELDEGVRMMGNVTDVDAESVRIGDKVQVWFADAGDPRPHPPLEARLRIGSGARSRRPGASSRRQ